MERSSSLIFEDEARCGRVRASPDRRSAGDGAESAADWFLSSANVFAMSRAELKSIVDRGSGSDQRHLIAYLRATDRGIFAPDHAAALVAGRISKRRRRTGEFTKSKLSVSGWLLDDAVREVRVTSFEAIKQRQEASGCGLSAVSDRLQLREIRAERSVYPSYRA